MEPCNLWFQLSSRKIGKAHSVLCKLCQRPTKTRCSIRQSSAVGPVLILSQQASVHCNCRLGPFATWQCKLLALDGLSRTPKQLTPGPMVCLLAKDAIMPCKAFFPAGQVLIRNGRPTQPSACRPARSQSSDRRHRAAMGREGRTRGTRVDREARRWWRSARGLVEGPVDLGAKRTRRGRDLCCLALAW